MQGSERNARCAPYQRPSCIHPFLKVMLLAVYAMFRKRSFSRLKVTEEMADGSNLK